MHKSAVEPLVLNWNKLAMENLRENKFSESLRLLQKAEELLKYPDGTDPSKLLAITYNNFGCFYKKTEKYPIALKYLFKALDIEVSSISDRTNLAGTHLNICAVYSILKQHNKALSHGILATKLLKESSEAENNINTLTSLIIALHNTALEYEFLHDFDNSLATYRCAMELAVKHLGVDHQITQALSKSFSSLNSKLNEKSSRPEFSKLFVKKPENLPSIKLLPGRNKSVGSNSKFNTQIISKKESRTSSNKTFSDHKSVRKQLPSLGKNKTVKKRSKKILKDLKVQGLEEKINQLQSQIFLYQKKYQELEEKAYANKLDKNEAAIIIQRFWRKYREKRIREKKKKNLKPVQNKYEAKAKIALQELESLKMQVLKDINSPLQKSPVTFKMKETNLNIGTKFNSTGNRLHKNIKIPLDPIRESKIETKEMKAVLLQSHIRRFLARKKYLKVKTAAEKIQRSFRKHQCQSLFENIKTAIITIQRAWRKYSLKTVT